MFGAYSFLTDMALGRCLWHQRLELAAQGQSVLLRDLEKGFCAHGKRMPSGALTVPTGGSVGVLSAFLDTPQTMIFRIPRVFSEAKSEYNSLLARDST